MENQQTAASIQALAKSIYVELVARNTQITEGAVKLGASAANLAALSIKLAEAFVQAEEEAATAKAPPKSQKLEGSELAKWMK